MSLFLYAHRFANNSHLLQKCLAIRKSAKKERSIRNFQSVGYDVHQKVYDVLRDSPFRFFALSGTLLGLVRDGGFIPYDDDLDYGIMIDEDTVWHSFENLMESNGFHPDYYYVEDHNITEMSFRYHGVNIDFFGMRDCGTCLLSSVYYRRKQIDYEKDEVSTMHITYPAFLGIKEVACKGYTFPIPVNAEEFLASNYGENWRIPDKNVTLETKNGTREYFDNHISSVIQIKGKRRESPENHIH